jgi:hypothetical protein
MKAKTGEVHILEKRYQVFISSTFVDLEDERKEVMEAIINLNCFPAGMEMFPASDTEQFDYIKRIIDESDYYVIVVAGKYGSVAEDGISYTEKEFDYAKEKKIPILAFVKKDIETIPGNKIETDHDKKTRLDAFREKVLDGRVAKFWDTPDELKYKIHNSLSNEFKIHPRPGWIRGNQENNEELLVQINKLRLENNELEEKITKGIEVTKKNGNNKENDKDNDTLVKLNKNFLIYYSSESTKAGMPLKIMQVSLFEIIKKIGPKLLDEIDFGQFEIYINTLIIEPEYLKNSGYKNSCFIAAGSIEEIKVKFLALNILQMGEYSEIMFSAYGKKIYFDSIVF